MNQARPLSMSDALSSAWQRMKLLLMRPFSLELWFAVGFSSFLANLGEGAGGGSGLRIHNGWNGGDSRWDGWSETGREIQGAWQGIHWDPWTIIGTGFLLMAALCVFVLFLWLSSRGQFMFVDNLVTRRGQVSVPWNRYGRLGDSLFQWRLVYSVICLLVFGALAFAVLLAFVPLGLGELGAVATLLAVVVAGSLAFLVSVTAIYIEFFLGAFVVPIMYRENLTAGQAWAVFLPLFRRQAPTFVLFGMFYLAVAILGALGLTMLGMLTCCVGLLVLALPYIGSVASLPLTVLQRYWTLEFLGRVDPRFDLLGPIPPDPDHRSVYDDGDGTVIGTENLGQDTGGDQSRPEDS